LTALGAVGHTLLRLFPPIGRRGAWRVEARSAPLAIALVAVAGCRSTCPAGSRCGTASWLSDANDPVVEGIFRAYRAVEARDPSLGPGADPESLSVRDRPILLRFDVSEITARGWRVERATLLLAPHARWATLPRSVRLAVHPVTASGSSVSGEEPAPAADPCAVATIPLAMRGPVRVDVTDAARAWTSGAVVAGALALSADADGLVLEGASAVDPLSRPRLEVVLR
jgi:hypothetical protein